MNQKTLADVENGVERLIAAYTEIRSDNVRLREELASLQSRQELLKSRLDALIEKIDGVVKP